MTGSSSTTSTRMPAVGGFPVTITYRHEAVVSDMTHTGLVESRETRWDYRVVAGSLTNAQGCVCDTIRTRLCRPLVIALQGRFGGPKSLRRKYRLFANDRQVSNSPWTYYDYIFRLPILQNQTTVNYERYRNQAAWKLVQQLDKTPDSDQATLKRLNGQIQQVFLQDLPAIPLWYNGLWAQYNTNYWTNFPSSTGNQALPTLWRNYLQMTGIDMLTRVKPQAES